MTSSQKDTRNLSDDEGVSHSGDMSQGEERLPKVHAAQECYDDMDERDLELLETLLELEAESNPQEYALQSQEDQDSDCNSSTSITEETAESETMIDEGEEIQQAQTETDEIEIDVKHYSFGFHTFPVQMTGAWRSFDAFPANFLKGCKWSPDGTCILTNSDDDKLRVFNLPNEIYHGQYSDLAEMDDVFSVAVGELVYDYAWYPPMKSTEPSTCCFVSSSRDHPIQMWDAFTGQLRCTYRAFDHLDEMVSPLSVAFSMDGKKLYCGFNKKIRVFYTDRPGRDCEERLTHAKKKGQAGIISCIAMNPQQLKLYAAGSYCKLVGIYSESKGKLEFLLGGHQGGLTHLKFSPDGNLLYSGGRKDSEILCWDIRNPSGILYRMVRGATSNQRVYFDIDSTGKYIASGNQDSVVTVWDTTAAVIGSSDGTPTLLPLMTYAAHNDAVNGLSLHPSLPIMATASGERKFPVPMASDSDSDDDIVTSNQITRDNSLRLWFCR